MKHIFCFLSLLVLVVATNAETVESCDGKFSARASKSGLLIVERAGKRLWARQLNHEVEGGIFNSDNSMLVLYGLPRAIDVVHPQGTRLTVFSIRSRPRELFQRTYGGGIFEIAFGNGNDEGHLFLNSRFAIEIINLKTETVESFDLLSEPAFDRQVCNG